MQAGRLGPRRPTGWKACATGIMGWKACATGIVGWKA